MRPVQRLYPLDCVDSAVQGDGVEDVIEPSEDAVEPPQESHLPGLLPTDESASAGVSVESRVPVKVTRSGRISKPPFRFSV